ncbi:MAG TPA: 4-alpha-glucanotransferase [Gemmatimonadaceae bacterium]
MSSALHELADAVGIVPEYRDQTGREVRTTSDDTRRAILAALGIDASTDAAARDALATSRQAARDELIAPVRVVERGDPALNRLRVRSPHVRGNGGSWRAEIAMESGDRLMGEGHWHGEPAFDVELPGGGDVPLGYHRVRLSVAAGGVEWNDEQTLIVVPARCVAPDDLVGPGGAFGLIASLYTVKSDENWGVGDLTDLGRLATWGAGVGADFVGVNPLHSLLNRGTDISPYSPVSRLFRNSIYIDVTRVPELDQAADVRDLIASPEIRAELEALRESPAVRYEQVMGAKGLALDALHRVFREHIQGSGTARDRAYSAYVAAAGESLTRYATWMAIAELRGRDWTTWPQVLRTPTSIAVRIFAETHRTRVDFHRWLQFEIDRQLSAAAARARAAGMRIGLYQDLAIGTAATGADVWSFPHLFVRGASIGAPPDPYAAQGQNWGLPPIDPRALHRDRYRYFIELVRSGFAHAGALRIDHVMGLFRLFWIPEGKTGAEGAYVRYPWRDLLGIVALESVRNNALVVGEDLGTVPPDVPAALEKWGVLSSKVLYFERGGGGDGSFTPAHRYPSLALATANTHDMATVAGFWEGRDIDVRRSVGLIASDSDAERAHLERADDRRALVARLVEEGLLPHGTSAPTLTELTAAVHAFLCRTPARLAGMSLDDLAGELEAVNVPGVGPELHASWTRKMRDSLEVIATSSDVRARVRCEARGGGASRVGPADADALERC